MHIINKLLLTTIFIIAVNSVWSQSDTVNTITISLEKAQQLLIEQNLQLVATKYEINIAEAQLKQARQWRNPLFVWNADLYSLELNQFLNYRNQKLIQVEQVISISGKHRNEVRLAKKNVELAKLQVEDVMRGLLYECAVQYTELQYLQEQEKIFELSINRLQDVLNFLEQQYAKGNIAGKEIIRIKTELLDLKSQQQSNKISIQETSTSLRILMGFPEYVEIKTITQDKPLLETFDVERLVNMAKEIRPDYLLRKKSIEYEQQNLKLQQSNAIPDFNFGYQPHDKGSNYVRPYSGIVFEMAVPLFDRNQGGIQEAKIKIKQAETNLKILDLEIEQELQGCFKKFQLHKEGLERYNSSLMNELEDFNNKTIDSYNKRLINILELVDQQRIFLQTKSQQLNLYNDFIKTINELNFKVGNKIVN
jgi:cobalt-zinc-cadmium efflux system outer membrane protein